MAHNRNRRFFLRLLIVLLLLVAGAFVGIVVRSVAAQAQQSPPAWSEPTQRDVTYCTPGGVPLKMDIYMPSKSGDEPTSANPHTPAASPAALPAALFVHGGSWSGGDKASGEGAAEIAALVGRGYVVASINYRLAPQYVFPAQIHDVKCAVRYLRANAASLNIAPDRIGAWGASAGGHLVSLLGTADASAGMEGDGGYANQSSRVQAVVDMYGRADLTTIPATRPDLLPIFGDEAALSRYSPVTYVSKDDPPFLILHGEQDTVVPPELSQEFYARLKAAGVPVTLVMVKNGKHGFPPEDATISPSRAEITQMVGDFFDHYLKEKESVTPASPNPNVSKPAASRAQPLPASGDTMNCVQTGKAIRGVFLTYWKSHGDVEQEGYPISSELEETSATAEDLGGRKVYTVQYFERAVLEYHAENQPPYDVLPSRLGAQRYKAKYPSGAPDQHPNNSEGSAPFEQTGHRVGGVFLQYWQQHGGVTQQGYPVSDEFMEVSALDGKPYTVQYFERAVFEYHPENAGTPYEVLLSQLGALRYKTQRQP